MDQTTATIDLDTQISNLEKRQFIIHTAKKSEQKLFKRRRSISYRIGPFTREQVSTLMTGRRPEKSIVPELGPDPADPAAAPVPAEDTVPIAPQTAEGVTVRYLDPGTAWASKIGADPMGTRLEPAAAAAVQLLYDDTKAGVNHTETYEGIVYPLDGVVDVTDVFTVDHDDRDFNEAPPEGIGYATVDVKLKNKTFWSGLESDLKNHLVANRRVEVFHNPDLRLYSRVGESESDFRKRCEEAAEAAADKAMVKLAERYETRIDRVKGQISTADSRVRELEAQASAKEQEEVMSGAGDLLGALLGGRRSSDPLGKAASRRAATQKATARAEGAHGKLTAKQVELQDLEDELSNEMASIVDDHVAMAGSIETVDIGLEKTDVRVADLKLVWVTVG
jgi:hypothetical protein